MYGAGVRLRYFEAKGMTQKTAIELVEPLSAEVHPIYNTTNCYGNFLLPGLFLLILQQTLLIGFGESIAKENEKNKFSALFAAGKNKLPFSELNIVPYYALADTVLSEASSTVFDFLAFSKFGIIYDLPCDKLSHSDGEALLEIDNREFLKNAFSHIDSSDQITHAIEKSIHPTEEMIKHADIYRDRYFYKLDGKATERFVKKMEELYYEGSHENIPYYS